MIAKCQLPPSSLCNSLSLADARQLPWNTPQSPAVTAPLKRGACPYPLPPLLRGGGCVSSRRGVLLQGEVPSIARRRGVPTKVAAKQAEGCSNGSDYEAARGVFRRRWLQSSRRGAQRGAGVNRPVRCRPQPKVAFREGRISCHIYRGIFVLQSVPENCEKI